MVAERCVSGHSAYIYDRGGMTRVGAIEDISSIRWERDRDGVSEAQVILAGRSCANQRRLIEGLIAKRHELVIFRQGQRVWEGPLWRIGDEGDRVVIVAHDVGEYLFGTPLTKIWDNSYDTAGDIDRSTEVTTRMGNIIDWELTHSRVVRRVGGGTVTFPAWESLDPPANVLPYLVVHHFPNEARTAAKTLAFEMTVGEHLQNYARTGGIDYTVVGRAVHIWDVSRSIGRTRTWTEADFFGNIIITEYGADHTQAAYVVSQDGAYGEAGVQTYLDLYGPWTKIFDAFNEEGTDAPSQAELDSQASRNTSGRQPVPVEVRVPDNSSVRLGPTLSIDDLVPGVQVPLLATLNSRQWSQMQKIDHVVVEETADGETVSVTLTPATRPDEDEETD
jgi:hypothetical protein